MRVLLLSIAVLSLVTVGCTQNAVQKPDLSGSTATNQPPHAAKYVTLTVQNFEEEVLKSTEPVLVDFWATWCGPCKAIAPAVEAVAVDYQGKAKVGKVDIDAQEALALKYNVEAIPVLIVFKDGKEVTRQLGVPQGDHKTAIKGLIDKAL